MTSDNTPAPAPSWTVTYQQESQQVDTGNRVVKGVTVGFQTGTGQQGSVFVPDTQYTPDQVRTAIAARAAQLDTIAGMTSAG